VLTLRAAAGLLGSTVSVGDLRALAAVIGFHGECAVLDPVAHEALGLDDGFVDTRLLRGPGSLRALLFEAARDQGRQQLSRAAARLAARAPHVLWLMLAVEPDGHRVLLGVSTPGRRGPRVAALIVDRARVLDSDAETLRQLAAVQSADDLATHARFAEVLGRDALTRRFFRKLEECVAVLAASARGGSENVRREVGLLYASRLLFLAFLEAKGWLDGDAAFMSRAFDQCMAAGGSFHQRVLLPLFFGTLNTPFARRSPRARAFGQVPFLNGGLFTPTRLERTVRRLRFSDDACGCFFDELLSRYRFTAREETASFEEAAIDPEMLGRAFESLMAVNARKTSGAYYTPHELVDRVTTQGLEAYLASQQHPPTLESLGRIRVLDPACGSGAFLVHVLDRLSHIRRGAGDDRPLELVRRDVLAQSIFGVDVNPTAVWLCQLRLWLSIVVDSRDGVESVRPLPNLDRNLRIGDSLAGPAFADAPLAGGSALRRLRERYARSSGKRKTTLARELDRQERRLVIAAGEAELARISRRRRDLVVVRRGRDLFGGRYQPSRDEKDHAATLRLASLAVRRRLRAVRAGGPLAFSFPAHFADVDSEGGFSIIVGNPPWVRPHHLETGVREALRRAFFVARAAPWLTGASAAGAGTSFAAQVDLAAIFVERSLRLLSERGTLSLLLPSKLWRSLAGGGLRQLLTTETRLARVDDYSDVPAAFDAAVYPGLLVASRDRTAPTPVNITVLHRSRTAIGWYAPPESLPFDGTPGAPWLLAPPDVRKAFERIRAKGVAMSDSRFGRPLLGVKSGLNEAFIVGVERTEPCGVTIFAANGRSGVIEPSALRPVLRGEQVHPWSVAARDDRIIWTHGIDGQPLAALPDGVARWLAPHRRSLAARSDASRAKRWWSLFRTEAAASDQPRVVWADIGRSLRATVLDGGDPTVPLNTCYVARSPTQIDALALCALLNSPLATAWVGLIAEPARGGFHRYLGWTMAMLPIPDSWSESRTSLAALGARCIGNPAAVDREALLNVVIAAYRVRRRDVEPLLTWTAP
jgi:hypothetical protein